MPDSQSAASFSNKLTLKYFHFKQISNDLSLVSLNISNARASGTYSPICLVSMHAQTDLICG